MQTTPFILQTACGVLLSPVPKRLADIYKHSASRCMQHSRCWALSVEYVKFQADKWCWKQEEQAWNRSSSRNRDYTFIIPTFFFVHFQKFPNGRQFFFLSFTLNGKWHLGQVLSLMQTEQQQPWKSEIWLVFCWGWIAEFYNNLTGCRGQCMVAKRKLQEPRLHRTYTENERMKMCAHTREYLQYLNIYV